MTLRSSQHSRCLSSSITKNSGKPCATISSTQKDVFTINVPLSLMPLHYRSTNVPHRLQPTTPLLSLDMWSFLPSTVIYNVPPFAPHPNSQMDLSQVLSPQKQSHMTVFAYSSFVRLKILEESGEMICVWQENTADKPKWLVNHPSTYEKWMESHFLLVRKAHVIAFGWMHAIFRRKEGSFFARIGRPTRAAEIELIRVPFMSSNIRLFDTESHFSRKQLSAAQSSSIFSCNSFYDSPNEHREKSIRT